MPAVHEELRIDARHHHLFRRDRRGFALASRLHLLRRQRSVGTPAPGLVYKLRELLPPRENALRERLRDKVARAEESLAELWRHKMGEGDGRGKALEPSRCEERGLLLGGGEAQGALLELRGDVAPAG